MAPALPKTTQN